MPRMDALIFDVDGVLVDANATYLLVIQKTLHYMLSLNGPGKRFPETASFSLAQYEEAKKHPAFNDDYDLGWFGLSALLAHKDRWKDSWETEQQILPQRLWENLLREAPEEGTLTWIQQTFPQGPSRQKVRTLCEEFYFGREYPSITGKEALMPPAEGLWKKDRPLIAWHWKELPLPCAIYTGRPLTELRLALGVLGWEDFPLELCVTPDSGVAKPSPRGLEVLAEKLQSGFPGFFGDSQSDAKAFEAYGKGKFFPIGPLLSGDPAPWATLDDALKDAHISLRKS